MMNRKYTVYEGRKNGRIAYIGTTIQVPSERFRWHKYNGKPLDFKVLFQFDNKEDMLEKEFELIKKHNPSMNKIKDRRQNLNKKLTYEDLQKRVGDPQWCQSCLRRRVNKGYTKCMWCK